jgi:hypothetical protein
VERARLTGIQEYRLVSSDHERGVSCDADGPAIGPIRLLVRVAQGFEPRSCDELQSIFDAAFERPFDCADLTRGLDTVARALNDGDVARAMMATLFLHLPVLTENEAARARNALGMLKASPDDPKHPGWPKGTSDGRGGKFRPKDAAVSEETKEIIERRLKRLIFRRAIRAGLRSLLSWRRLVRLGGETVSNAVPVLDIIGDAAMVADIESMAEDAAQIRADAEVAEEFASKGPYPLEKLQASPVDEEFPTFGAFKKIDLVKRFGDAPAGYEYHHIVEQNAEGDIAPGEINSTRNIVCIPKLIHEEINSEYSRIPKDTGQKISLRDSLDGASFEKRWEEGLAAMRRVGFLE